MAFFKNMWKGSGKHHKLEPGDEKCLAKDLEGEPSSIMSDSVSFNVKYLGSTIVSNNTTTTSAVDTILTMAKVTKRKKCTVTVTVTLNGIMVTDSKTGNLILDASVYRISNCSTDPRGNIFTFFSINKNDITECHAFQCSKRKMAQNITLTVAHSFRAAYEVWQRGHQVCSQLMEQKPVNGRTSKKNLDVPSLIDLETNDVVIETNDNSSNSWVRFDKDETSEIMPKNNKNIQLVQPTNYFPSAPHLAENFNDNFVWT